MGKIIMITHGDLAKSFYETAGMFIAKRDGLTVLGLGVDMEDFKSKLRSALLDGEEDELLILADLFGGTPFNLAVTLCREAQAAGKRIEILTGLNLSMLLEILPFLEDKPCSELKEMAFEAGRDGIRDLMAELKCSE